MEIMQVFGTLFLLPLMVPIWYLSATWLVFPVPFVRKRLNLGYRVKCRISQMQKMNGTTCLEARGNKVFFIWNDNDL